MHIRDSDVRNELRDPEQNGIEETEDHEGKYRRYLEVGVEHREKERKLPL